MFDTSFKNIDEESRGAIEYRDAHQEQLRERTRNFHGPFYDNRSADSNPENHAFEYISLYVPRTIYDNPKVKEIKDKMPEFDYNPQPADDGVAREERPEVSLENGARYQGQWNK